jgi:hypothetical protein
MRTLAERIDEIAEAEFWDGAEIDAITDALLLSWFEAKSTRYSSDEIVAALLSAAADLSKQTYH